MDADSQSVKYSVVIPVYNSAPLVGQTIDQVVDFFERQGWAYELILVNDGSRDESWSVLREKSAEHPQIAAISLLRNYGQHTAIYCGFERSTGDWVITLDDDLQNPPDQIVHLVEKAAEGHDVVYGRPRSKKHAWYRRLGSSLIALVNRRVFHCPPDIVPTNYRLIRRDVLDRIVNYNTPYPYITGLTIMFAANPANTWVEHRERPVGRSQYTFLRIVSLVMRLLFNYSAWPLHFVTTIGALMAVLSFVVGLYFLVRRLLGDIRVPGWTTIIVMLSLFNGISLLVLSMLGEYVVRLIQQTSSRQIYHVKEAIDPRE
jgi:glycosyltransferase involved in cell wall biosynthesis